ncbi:MAG: hypothetical protein KAS02_02725 [Candidatus Pacebacteria bacterium]|nr:hypothetical protein [Candidatus Paceibacterota bacterium]
MKKKLKCFAMVFFFGMVIAGSALAGGSIKTNAEYVDLDKGKGFWIYNVEGSLPLTDRVNIGFDSDMMPETDYQQLSFYGTYEVSDGFNLLAGGSTNSNGADHIRVGTSFFKAVGKFSCFIASDYYIAVSDEAVGYLDLFTDIKYQVNDKFAVSITGFWDPAENGTSFALAGPAVEYLFSESLTAIGRLSRCTDFKGNGGWAYKLYLVFSGK